ncbi:uncharacterized protein Z520_00241 [Fonsecaea multimorphosa CBS 102226]|uniref:NTF2 domain-containing protein n=1 Tax=Fonsecaea multimorphosa CBS 102226 TaxID=1442371 RepID=A0A0D2KJ79_9EURO|nr:uncharacterized protein Z520_00241 [Fonsecaea multimorphosa CBS 102226]KIY03550.1 hypothetical protein Z520_00241 [Fonsecaea multimorphosa CBS 102226]OAL32254.1 hypothetical protein AYO22_00276 [Fonsecaea multimorphosa]
MATETVPVNGLYGATHYGQPAELAASTPSAPAHAASASQSTTTSATQQKADPQEIGWYFVEQYYTTLSKSPEKIHLFYSKKSQLVTGVEAEKVVPAVGTKAISEKIKALDLQDCKVRVLNVDSQASFNNIVVQVIGEMSNKSEPHHKFVQTFVLAEQPNGYFVLNDIFRYLSDDEDEIVEDEQPQAEVPAEEPPTPAAGVADIPSHSGDVVATEDAVEKVDEILAEEKVEETQAAEEAAEVNGDAVPAPAEEAAEATELSGPTEEANNVAQETTEPAVSEQPAEPEAVAAEPATEAAAPAPTPAEAPPAKKTWASMLGGGVQKPAVPALPLTPAPQPKAPRPTQPTQAPKAPVEPVPATPNTTSSTPTSQSNGWQTADHSKKSNRPPNRTVSEGTTMAYIKNVNDKVDARILREVLEKYGELKYFDVARPRNCAFVEFADAAGYAAAVAANPHTVGTEQIYVEERRPRPNAYGGSNANFNRGGGTANRGRGGMQSGRSGSQTNFPKDAGRGGGFQRGGKPGTGTVTPKGRGQGQAA